MQQSEVPPVDRGLEARALLILVLPLRDAMLRLETEHQDLLQELPVDKRASARNLIHYLSLRQHDLRGIQPRLTDLGLSSLGRAESHTLSNLESVIQTLAELARAEVPPLGDAALDQPLRYAEAQEILSANARKLLGETPAHRLARIMITMPTEAAHRYEFVRDLLAAGMECMRINCAHDTTAEWAQMILHLQRAEKELGKTCRIEMDLCGPRLRTGPLQQGAAALKVRPLRDPSGHVLKPAELSLTEGELANKDPACLRVSPGWIQHLETGDMLHFEDVRGSKRTWLVTGTSRDTVQVQASKTAYLAPGLELTRNAETSPIGSILDVSVAPGAILLHKGDELILTRDMQPGIQDERDPDGVLIQSPSIGCTLAGVFDDVKPGEQILFDDGRIQGVINSVNESQVQIKITRARPGGTRLRPDKGINLPDSLLRLSALTEKDHRDLEFVVRHADIVGLSFTNTAEDVRQLQQAIDKLGSGRPHLVLKIETRRGFDNLPSILLAAMQIQESGVMVARGDLAVELGFERLAEAQEEMLWLCEAAHVPVIWATQVLESLARDGLPSRAEITDAAMADRTECVMLNKGPHILSAVKTLADILHRMQAHQKKKQSMLRELHVAHGLDSESGSVA